ncbi:hypothetical protein HK102_006279 [Quaeritorhiza haematococci]|nr:hypothetical protein HK102_006279 [Quaeritorhiza haematococci]
MLNSDLENNLFSGSIPASIGQLRNLRYLDVSGNQLSGQIPGTIGSLQLLDTLLIDSNSFTGQLPNEIGQLILLRRLDASSNAFSGPIPGGISELKGLEAIKLHRNRFSGNVPSFQGLTKLWEIDIADNPDLGGPLSVLPASLGTCKMQRTSICAVPLRALSHCDDDGLLPCAPDVIAAESQAAASPNPTAAGSPAAAAASNNSSVTAAGVPGQPGQSNSTSNGTLPIGFISPTNNGKAVTSQPDGTSGQDATKDPNATSSDASGSSQPSNEPSVLPITVIAIGIVSIVSVAIAVVGFRWYTRSKGGDPKWNTWMGNHRRDTYSSGSSKSPTTVHSYIDPYNLYAASEIQASRPGSWQSVTVDLNPPMNAWNTTIAATPSIHRGNTARSAQSARSAHSARSGRSAHSTYGLGQSLRSVGAGSMRMAVSTIPEDEEMASQQADSTIMSDFREERVSRSPPAYGTDILLGDATQTTDRGYTDEIVKIRPDSTTENITRSFSEPSPISPQAPPASAPLAPIDLLRRGMIDQQTFLTMMEKEQEQQEKQRQEKIRALQRRIQQPDLDAETRQRYQEMLDELELGVWEQHYDREIREGLELCSAK